jgi:hypothetical protein
LILLEMIAWVSTGLAGVFLVLMLFGLDDLFGGMFEARVVAFFGAGLGWGSVLMHESGYSIPASLAAGVATGCLLGAIALGLVLAIRRASSVTESAGSSPVGQVAEVVIAPDGSMQGMVRVMHRGQISEFPATFSSPAAVGGLVEVVGSLPGKLKVRTVDSTPGSR